MKAICIKEWKYNYHPIRKTGKFLLFRTYDFYVVKPGIDNAKIYKVKDHILGTEYARKQGWGMNEHIFKQYFKAIE